MISLSPQLRKALIAQTCCGIPELCDFLNDEVELIWDCQDDTCNDRLRYIHTQLALIEAAQIFARGKIDTMIRTAESNTQERYTAFSNTRTDAERDSSGKTCHWATSTSQQFFNRDSHDSSVEFSDYRLMYTSQFKNNGYDKSCRHTTGTGFHMSKVTTTHFGNHDSFDRSESTSSSDTQGGTDPYVPIRGLTVTGFVFEGFDEFPFFTLPHVEPPIDFLPVQGPVVCVPDFDPENPQDFLNGCNTGFDGRPSMGQGYNIRFKFGVTAPTLGTLDITWDVGFNERQYWSCNSSANSARRDVTGLDVDDVTGTTDASEKDNQTYSSEQTTIAHLVRKYGITIRRGTTDLDAEMQSTGHSEGIAHSESARNTKGTGYHQSRAESETTKHGENHLKRTETANDDMTSTKYGQISTHLGQLWKRVWEQMLQLERQFSAIPMGANLNCDIRGSKCFPVRVSYLDLNRAHLHGIH